MTLIITEKGSQGKHLSKIMDRCSDAEQGLKIGVYEGIEFIICPLSGHIFEADKEHVNLLNFTPPTYLLKRVPDTSTNQKKNIHYRVKHVQQNYFSDIDNIILATDPDMEGCSIAKEVVDYYGFDRIEDITYMDISNTTEKALRKALNNALTTKKNHIDWERFAFASMLKSDFSLTGLAVSYTMNKALKDKDFNAFYTFGTQQTRALDLVVSRYREHKDFDTSKHYRIKAHTDKGVFVYSDEGDTREMKRIQRIADELSGDTINITETMKKQENEQSPKWYDGSHIGSQAVKATKLSLQEIFSNKDSVMQNMYEKGLLTYIRGEAKGKMPMLDFDLYAQIAKSIAPAYNASRVDTTLVKNYLWRKEDSKEKVNHTPCTLADIIDVTKYSGTERIILDIASKQILATFYPDAIVMKYGAEGITRSGHIFLCLDKETLDLGWKELYGKKPYVLENEKLKTLSDGENLKINRVEVEEYEKTPPPLFTEATLLDAIKKKGIGSESTFGEIINFILDRQISSKTNKKIIRDYCKLNSKKQILPTEKGMSFVDAFPEKLKNSLKIFENDVLGYFIDKQIDEDKALELKNKISANLYENVIKYFVEDLEKFASYGNKFSKSEKIEINLGLTCPLCKEGEVIEKNKVFSCSKSDLEVNKKGGGFIQHGCPFTVFKEKNKFWKYSIASDTLSILLEEGVAKIKAYNIKGGFDKEIRLKFDDEYKYIEEITI